MQSRSVVTLHGMASKKQAAQLPAPASPLDAYPAVPLASIFTAY
jgi:hypothetical protein